MVQGKTGNGQRWQIKSRDGTRSNEVQGRRKSTKTTADIVSTLEIGNVNRLMKHGGEFGVQVHLPSITHLLASPAHIVQAHPFTFEHTLMSKGDLHIKGNFNSKMIATNWVCLKIVYP